MMIRHLLPATQVGRSRQSRSLIIACFAITLFVFLAAWEFLTLWDPIGPILARPLESRFSATEPARPIAGIIALGGDFARVVEAIKLAERFPEAKLIVSVRGDSYSPYILGSLAFLKGRLILESKSRNTYENAAVAAELVVPSPAERWIIVTSGPHMPRAVGVFRKAGFTVHAWPIVYAGGGSKVSLRVAIYEWFGLIVYWLLGRTDSLFSGPVAPESA